MRESRVVEVEGQFVGAAVAHGDNVRFVAIDPRAEELDDSIWPSLTDLQRVVRHLLTSGRLPPVKAEPSDTVPTAAAHHAASLWSQP
jgi:hypothetical protein